MLYSGDDHYDDEITSGTAWETYDCDDCYPFICRCEEGPNQDSWLEAENWSPRAQVPDTLTGMNGR